MMATWSIVGVPERSLVSKKSAIRYAFTAGPKTPEEAISDKTALLLAHLKTRD